MRLKNALSLFTSIGLSLCLSFCAFILFSYWVDLNQIWRDGSLGPKGPAVSVLSQVSLSLPDYKLLPAFVSYLPTKTSFFLLNACRNVLYTPVLCHESLFFFFFVLHWNCSVCKDEKAYSILHCDIQSNRLLMHVAIFSSIKLSGFFLLWGVKL